MADDWGNDPIQSMGMDHAQASALFDKTFGKGVWRLTGGYRTPGREAELRGEGAMTVAPGGVSGHSKGLPDAPGAYDIVVDGLTPEQASAKLKSSGTKFTKLLPEATHGTQGSHLHVQPEMTFQDDWGNDPIQKVEAAKPKPPAQPGRRESFGQEFSGAIDQLKSDWKTANAPSAPNPRTPLPANAPVTDKVLNFLSQGTKQNPGGEQAAAADRVSSDILDIPASIGRGVIRFANPKIDHQAAGGYLAAGLLAAPMLGEIPKAAPATNALRATVKADPAHVADIKILHENGIRMTPGQIKGGTAKAVEEKQQSAPMRGPAIKDAVDNSVSDFNRAMYGKATKLIGEDYPKDGPVGEKAIDTLFEKGEQKYEAIKPKIKLQSDPALEGDFKTALDSVGPAALPERADLQHIIDTRVKPAFKDGKMDGQSFKDTESFLTKQSKALRLGTAYQQREADAIDDVLSSLRNNAETHSPPEVSKDLKALNSYWASINRLSDASYAAKAQGGRFTPNQMLTAAGKGGRYQRRMVARGKAFDQDLISAAQRVLPNKIPNSGTTDRALANKGPLALAGAGMGATAGYHLAGAEGAGVGGLLGGLAGHAADAAVAPTANSLARTALARSAQKQLVRHGVTPRNSLAQYRPGSLAPAAALSAPTAGTQVSQ